VSILFNTAHPDDTHRDPFVMLNEEDDRGSHGTAVALDNSRAHTALTQVDLI
jgi:hypothetical protein